MSLAMGIPVAGARAGLHTVRFRPNAKSTALVLLAVLLSIATLLWQHNLAGQESAAASLRDTQMRQLVAATSGDQGAILSEGQTAEERNAAIPLLKGPMEHARAFTSIKAGTPAYAAALKCLTQAVYYEAATEPLEGKKAVAQVVLNRVQHPAYPNSVCGVVYQGVDQPVCQFSFTCDGSLLRQPLPRLWDVSRQVAAAALGGYVEQSVGSATHYHADYVLPRWAYTLGKIEQLGRHIFYRFKGNAGAASFLSARWSGHEFVPAINFDRLRMRLAAREDTASVPQQSFTPGLTVAPSVTDRHAENDVGGRIDMTKEWRLTIPDPTEASKSYLNALGGQQPDPELAAVPGKSAI